MTDKKQNIGNIINSLVSRVQGGLEKGELSIIKAEPTSHKIVKLYGLYLVDEEEYKTAFNESVKIEFGDKAKYFDKAFPKWKENVIKEYMRKPFVTDEELRYNKPELKKLNKLRLEAFRRTVKAKYIDPLFLESKKLKSGSQIWYTPSLSNPKPKKYFKPNQYRFKGEVTKVHKGKNIGFFDIKVGSETFRRIDYHAIQERTVENHSNVVIPDSVKKMSTKELYNELKLYRPNKFYYHYGGLISEPALRAELSTREHIKRKSKKQKVGSQKFS